VAVEDEWLTNAAAQVMIDSLDESDRYALVHGGPAQAVANLFAFDREHFQKVDGWWRAGVDARGNKVGFVLPVLFQREARSKDGHPEGTVNAFRMAGYKGRTPWQRPLA